MHNPTKVISIHEFIKCHAEVLKLKRNEKNEKITELEEKISTYKFMTTHCKKKEWQWYHKIKYYYLEYLKSVEIYNIGEVFMCYMKTKWIYYQLEALENEISYFEHENETYLEMSIFTNFFKTFMSYLIVQLNLRHAKLYVKKFYALRYAAGNVLSYQTLINLQHLKDQFLFECLWREYEENVNDGTFDLTNLVTLVITFLDYKRIYPKNLADIYPHDVIILKKTDTMHSFLEEYIKCFKEFVKFLVK
ncbi:hypothetical protein A3Q56_00362 [Intoshia linei]|uniref:Uncharacterized protein n=1 Tax=Intoshia linei TaxID=1819745 RepID=A0A177BE70_9BILA|nr:hypothetical protein A3Q56_00362 [Intoshia linei]